MSIRSSYDTVDNDLHNQRTDGHLRSSSNLEEELMVHVHIRRYTAMLGAFLAN